MLKTLISQGYNWAIWPQISLVIFTLTFVGILFWVTRKKSADHYRYMADLAIDDNGEVTHGR